MSWLKPFIDELHQDNEILFLPDLASAHYTRAITDLFDEFDISYVPKEANPQMFHKFAHLSNFGDF